MPLLLGLARREHDVDDVVLHAVVHVDVAHDLARVDELLRRDHRLGLGVDERRSCGP